MNTRTRFSPVVCAALAAIAIGVAPASAHGHFEFHRTSNLDSSLVWVYYPSANPTAHYSPAWRAGSGDSTNCSYIGHGWLPLGWYDVKGHWDHYDSTIKGIATYLQDKACGDGTLRTQLFIHLKEFVNWGSFCETYCFDSSSDYYSNGCIKLSRVGNPSDLRLMHDGWHAKSGDSRHGSFWINDWLYVHD